jgi:hypothetical protein
LLACSLLALLVIAYLVRDSCRQWRTGRLDRVLEGDFDIML